PIVQCQCKCTPVNGYRYRSFYIYRGLHRLFGIHVYGVPELIVLATFYKSPVEGSKLLSNFLKMSIVSAIATPINTARSGDKCISAPKRLAPIGKSTARKMTGRNERNL